MNWDIIEGKWNQFKGEAQSQWGKLTDDDLDVIAGKQQKLVGRLQERYGYNKDRAEKAVEEWQSKVNN
ncbi:CsbD family protein [Marinicella gelatinilytica]|uniref:CsbD family protein n=1 Tax=Marinicella gelatinilytica TaxID=2996017 RepID=UPI0022609C73|nr:CsbD family protein [Marinicella gelatinilytica]MCX7544900.1 CsbD family protein [Marinicella gelatinilytica]